MYIEINETIQHFLEMFKDIWLQIILGLILFDIFTGIFKAMKFKRLNSSFGIQGLGKHLIYFFALIFSTYILKSISMSAFLYVIYIIYFIFYAISICENLYELNWKLIPKFVYKKLLIYQNAIDKGDISFIIKEFSKIKKGDLTTKDIEKNTNLSTDESRILRELIEKIEIDKEE